MKARILILSFALICSSVFAQKETSPTTNADVSVGQLIAQLTQHISPNYLTPDFTKNETGWLYKAERTNKGVALSWFVQSLQAGLTNTAYTDNWLVVRDKWLADSKAINTVKQAASLIKTLEENIRKNAFDKTWDKDRKDWESAINKMAQ